MSGFGHAIIGSGWAHHLEVVAVLVRRDQKARYQSTAMGVIWAVASPLLFLLIFYVLFGVLMPLGIPNYASHVMVGIVAWIWFQTSLNEAVTCIPWNANLINQPRFPRAALPVATVLSNMLTFLMTLPILLTLVIAETGQIGWPLLAMPAVVLVQAVVILSIAFFAAAMNVTFRDMQYIVPILLQLGYFLTPIFYDLNMVEPRFRWVLAANPFLHLIEAYRAILIRGQWPDMVTLTLLLLAALALMAVTLRYFRRASLRFLEELG